MERDDEREEDKERTQKADGQRESVCVRRIERGQKKYRKKGWKKDEVKE